VWVGFSWPKLGSGGVLVQIGNVPVGSIKAREFLD
jgi:hypothetical protein